MLRIEQAIFASRQTDLTVGYHLVVASDGVTDEDAHALTMWGPTHDSLVENAQEAESINWHPLPSGAYCVSRTRCSGTEYSGRGEEIYTHCLVVPAEVMARFSNNPFSLLKAAIADGRLEVLEKTPRTLPAFVLRGKASPVSRQILGQMIRELGVEKFSLLIETVLGENPLAVVTQVSTMHLMDAVLNSLPVDCRTAFSFTTGLKPSPRRPFRVQLFPAGTEDLRQLLRPFQATVFHLSTTDQQATPGSWARVVTDAVAEKRFRILSEELGLPSDGASTTDWQTRVQRLAQRLADADTSQRGDRRNSSRRHSPSEMSPVSSFRSNARTVLDEPSASRSNHRGDAAHVKSMEGSETAVLDEDLRSDPSQKLGEERPELIEQLEHLDDVVFEAIAGKDAALEQLRRLWPEMLELLGIEYLEESREQYLRHAQAVWDHCAISDEVRKSEQSLAALSVISLLLE